MRTSVLWVAALGLTVAMPARVELKKPHMQSIGRLVYVSILIFATASVADAAVTNEITTDLLVVDGTESGRAAAVQMQ